MISRHPFKPRGRLLDVMRKVGDPGLINLAAGLPSVNCVPKADLREAFAATLEENADEALGYHVPDGDVRLRELLVDRTLPRDRDPYPRGRNLWRVIGDPRSQSDPGLRWVELPPGIQMERVYQNALNEKVAFLSG